MSDAYIILLDRIRALETQVAQFQKMEIDNPIPRVTNPLLYCRFDGDYPYNTDFTGSAYGWNSETPTNSSAIFRPGKFGKAAQIAEATTNLITNPSFEIDTTGWTKTEAEASITSSTDWAYTGSHSCKMYGGTGSGAMLTSTFTVANGSSVTASIVAFASTSGLSASISIVKSDWTFLTGSGNVPISANAPTGLSITYTNNTGSTVTYFVLVIGPGTGQTLYVDSAQLEDKDHATPYCDGSLGVGHSWSGTDHASTSSRTDQSLIYPATSVGAQNSTGTIGGWFKFTKHGESVFWSGGTGYLQCFSTSSDAYLVVAFKDISNPIVVAWTPDDETWYQIAVTWNASGIKLYLDGDLVGTYAGSMASIDMSGDLRIGEYSSALAKLNGVADDFIVLDYELTTTQIKAYYDSGMSWNVRMI